VDGRSDDESPMPEIDENGVDRSQIRAFLRLTSVERLRRAEQFMEETMRGVGAEWHPPASPRSYLGRKAQAATAAVTLPCRRRAERDFLAESDGPGQVVPARRCWRHVSRIVEAASGSETVAESEQAPGRRERDAVSPAARGAISPSPTMCACLCRPCRKLPEPSPRCWSCQRS
jgi:hypothetical protein